MSTKSDQELSGRIIAQIDENGLLKSQDMGRLKKRIIQGDITSEDWIMFVENEIFKVAEDNDNACTN
ncbi:hypothetical protein KAR48_14140 [bacterium]|nr:hypothetical protein [bacterium]